MSFPHTQASFGLNELNRKNTHEGSDVVMFYESDVKFGLGFWTAKTPSDSLTDSPFLALIAWTPEGWQFISRLGVVWNDDLGMDMGSEEEDIYNYLWYIGQSFDEPLQDYLRGLGVDDIPATMWEKVLKALSSVVVENGHIKFPGTPKP